MSDRELDDVLSEMEFSSPSGLKGGERPSILKTKLLEDQKLPQRVLMPDESFTLSGNLLEIYGEDSIRLHDTSYIKPEIEQDSKRKSASGMCRKISKKLQSVCGRRTKWDLWASLEPGRSFLYEQRM